MITYKSSMPVLTLKYTPSEYKKVKVSSSTDLYSVLKDVFDSDTIEYREEMIVMYLDGGNRTVGVSKHSFGSTSVCLVDPKVILTEALLSGSIGIALSHNHPSGQIHPSKQDEMVTREIKKACEAVGIRFLDHIIVAGDKSGYYSFADEGKI